ncbi:MAG TPA: chromosomal replication initiator protein DnaA [Planctomycetaceae bacterium]|nr:chromosomal replication initiator protein DnaA [Planctomycetaceae bacterium]
MRPADPERGGSDDPRVSLVMTELKSRLGDRRFALWCEGKVRPSFADDQLTLAVGSPFLLNCMTKQFQPLLTEVAHAVIGPSARAVLTVDAALAVQPAGRRNSEHPAAAPIVTAAGPTPSLAAVRRDTAPQGRQRKLADLSEFVPHPANELAWTASRQVAATPGAHFSTLFLHGVVGTGKTHLLEGICRQLKRTHPALQVTLLTAEGFANYFTQALGDRTLPSFRQKFRGVDVLLVDDVDFFESKRVFQEEFLHTVGELADHGRQVVVSADRHPKLLTKLSDELVSRFHSGLVCRLESPDLETRRKIVAAKAVKLEGEFAAEALDYIAERFSGSVRELEGALNCLQTCFAMTQKRVTLATARQMLADLERDCKKIVKLADVERVVCNLFGLKAKDLKSDSRVRTLAQPRMLAMFLARRHTPSAYSEIGQHFGGRNHSTVMSAERKVEQWLTENASVRIATQAWTIGEIVFTLEQQLLAG